VKIKFRCYCCGDPITGDIALVTMMAEPVDRVFVMAPDHVERLSDDIFSTVATPETKR
jgi:hypothetical protein